MWQCSENPCGSVHVHAHLGGYKLPPNPVNTTPIARRPHSLRYDSFAFHEARIARLPASSIPLYPKFSAVSEHIRAHLSVSEHIRARSAKIPVSELARNQMRHNQRPVPFPCHASRIALPPSSPMSLSWRSRKVKGLLKNQNNRTIGVSSSESRKSWHFSHQHTHKEVHLPFWKHFRNGLATLTLKAVA